MNATSMSRNNILEENSADSDSDSNSEGIGEYYEPISATDGADEDTVETDTIPGVDNHYLAQRQIQSNGRDHHAAVNGVRPLSLSSDEEEDDRDTEEEERRRAESDLAVRQAFREDESRRNAPLTAENTSRVMEAMREISFAGLAPDWALSLPEEQWVERLRRLRHSPHPAV